MAAPEAADFHVPLDPRRDLAHVFCLETPRVVGNDWVVRYDNRALQLVPTARAKRHTRPRARVVVRETRNGALLIVARAPDGTEHVLDWQPIPVATHHPAYHAPPPSKPTPPPKPVAGHTRAGQPLSPRQMAVRARWSQAITAHVKRKAAHAAAIDTR